ncbi:c-type cytochrome [Gilvimarinus sp. F26214L]|uniref:c-type cytochrome n=1 Tax=Gilvimarinus sp. DZF01 TaxID=3461371 RepID=UPI0040468659
MKRSRAFLILALCASAHVGAEDQPEMSRGEYLARVGNCAACHTIEDGEPFAGGLKMAVPMLGAIYTTNITPDRETGIGEYSFEDFDRSMRLGIAKDGHRLYPAMPYPSYAKITEDDMQALYDFFMNEVEPVRQANQDNEIPGWLSMRWPLAIWNMLTLDEDRYEADESQSDEWNRGAYLTQGLGHCGACHTPRGLLFQEQGLDESDSAFLAGAPLDHWSASPLTGDHNVGLGRWTEDDVVQFLKTGKNRWGSAFGTMVEVVNNSTQYMTDGDLRAMAVYLKSLPAVHDEGEQWSYDSTSADKLARFDFEERGSQVYYEFCVSCHLYDGSGHGEFMPPLAGNPVVMDPDPSSLINLTLNGSLRVVVGGEAETYDMPYFRGLLDDGQIADVVSFMRSAWGHQASEVTAEDVAEIRAATDPRSHDIVVLKMK